jgi:CYTH domain-containing protein
VPQPVSPSQQEKGLLSLFFDNYGLNLVKIKSMNRKKYAILERERKFLVDSLPPKFESDFDFKRIFDCYIINSRLRLRRIESSAGKPIQYKLGQKYPAEYGEYEKTWMTNIYLEEKEYALLQDLPALELTKRRFLFPYRKKKFSVDIFEGKLEGLILCEIEIPEDDNSFLELPSFAVKEVTNDDAYVGINLASK